MQRMVLRHLSGSKANQVEEFPLNYFKELTFGRDPSCSVKYDPDRDDLVGRQHAKIVQDPSDTTQFIVEDLGSRNGTFVNKQRIVGATRIAVGDVIQFGAGGPELQFDLEPRPQVAARPTSDAGSPSPVPPTRSGVSDIPATRVGESSPDRSIPVTSSAAVHSPVGKATVERMMAETRRDSRRNVFVIGAVLLMVIVATGVFLAYWWKSEIDAAGKPPSSTEIAKRNTPAVVYIESGWELIHTPSGGKVYHEYILNLNPLTSLPFIPNGKRYVAVYLQFSDGSIEPSLTTSAKTTYDNKGDNQPVADTLAGSGFVVDSNGFILTNRHVAAAWKSRYDLSDALPGLIFRLPNQTEEPNQEGNDRSKKTKGKAGNKTALYGGLPIGTLKVLTPSLQLWNPSESKVFGGKPIKGKLLDGRNVYFEVTFAGTENPYNAALVRQSSSHDVALVKIEAPQSVAAVEMNDNYDQVQPGDEILIMGYPLVSPDVVASTKSHDPFNRTRHFKVVPAPTVTNGLIGKLLRDESSVGRRESRDLVSEFGDSYQLTANSTGAGNSGGPLFDNHGRVIGIFYARSGSAEGTAVTFAVPIRYGMQLMRTAPVGR